MSAEASVESVVVGAGAVGLAVARALALAGREVLVLEAEPGIGSGTSSRNSEVIHAGLYYPQGSLKARLCVAGRISLYDFCLDHGVPFSRLGKLIVATAEDEVATLDAVRRKAAANGVDDLESLTPTQVAKLEPAVSCVAAVFSPSTGIVDSHGLMLAYQGDAEAAGAVIAFQTPILRAAATADGFQLQTGGAEPMALSCRILVNAAGLGAPALARKLDGLPAAAIPRNYLCKGSYYALSGRAPFRHLIYPVPGHAGLGVHLTLDLGGQARFGPDTEWIETEGYDVDPDRALGFYDAIRRYWPGLPDGALHPAYAGIRPKISGPDEPAADFRIDGAAVHGLRGLVNLFGIESPGLTASLAIGEQVRALLAEDRC